MSQIEVIEVGPPPRKPAGANPPPLWMAWTVVAMGAIYYLAAFFLRSSPGVMTSELMRSFGITATQLGGLAASYYYAYILMQIPTGVLVDTLGPRKLLAGGAILAAAGTLLFGVTNSFGVASAARALTGATTAVAWVVTLKLATHWFPARMFALLSGLALFVGNLGGILAQVPLRLGIEHFDWRTVIISSAAGILIIGIAGWTIVRNDPADRGYSGFAHASFSADNKKSVWELLRGVPTIFTYRNIWLIFLAQGGFVAILAFTGLWGPPYLRVRFGLSLASAAGVCTVMSVCWAVASPVFGYLSDKIGRRKPAYVTGAMLSCAGWAAMIYVPGLSLTAFIVLAALTSFASGAVIIGFAFAKESVPIRFMGSVTGVVNMGNMIGPTLLQPAIGWALDRRWAGEMSGGLRVYNAGAFQTGFLVIIGWLLITSLLLALTRETNCNQTA